MEDDNKPPEVARPLVEPYTTSSKENVRGSDSSQLMSLSGENSPKPPNHEDQIRWFLVRCTVVFVVLAIIAFLITGNMAVLLTSTIIGVAVIYVFRYYFPPRRQ